MTGKLQIMDGADAGFYPKLAKARCEGFEGRFDASAASDLALAAAAGDGQAAAVSDCPSCAGPKEIKGEDPQPVEPEEPETCQGPFIAGGKDYWLQVEGSAWFIWFDELPSDPPLLPEVRQPLFDFVADPDNAAVAADVQAQAEALGWDGAG